MFTKTLPLSFTIALSPLSSLAQSVVLVGPNEGNFSPVKSVSLDDNGTPVIQTSSQAPSTNIQRSTPVNLTGIGLQNDTNLDVFNFAGAEVTLGNFADVQPSGVGILQADGTQITLNRSGGTAAFVTATEEMLQSPNLNSYLFYDGITPDPIANTADFSINFRFAFETSDYLVVQERNGNTFFTLTALDITGNPIDGANVLQFGENGGSAFSVYDWNTGYANSTYLNTQEYAFTVAQASEFFNGTGIQEVPIYGFAIDNDGDADVKFFGASDDTFLNNPLNAAIPGAEPIPEPAAPLLLLVTSSLWALGSGLWALRRRRTA